MKLIDEKTRARVLIGDTVTDFRGNTVEVLGWREPQHPASTGRVWTEHGEFFPSVFGLKFVGDDDD